MKKTVALLVSILLAVLPASALAAVNSSITPKQSVKDIDLSGYTFDELLDLKRRIDEAIWDTEEWQEVTVPAGVYVINDDIPPGYWTIRPIEGDTAIVKWGPKLNEAGTDLENFTAYASEQITSPSDSYYKYNAVESVSWRIVGRGYFVVKDGPVIFTPFTGHNLGFK